MSSEPYINIILRLCVCVCQHVFLFNDTATTEIYTLSLHDALPISHTCTHTHTPDESLCSPIVNRKEMRSEEHTSELQSHLNLVCSLLLEKTKSSLLSPLSRHAQHLLTLIYCVRHIL